MAGIHVGEDHAAGEFDALVVGVGTGQLEGGLGVLERVERHDGRQSAPVGFLVQVGGVGFVDAGRVAQHDGQEIGGGGGGVDGVAVALLGQRGDVAAVVDVGVGEHHGIHRGGIEAEGLVDGFGFLAAALEQAAIEEDARGAEFQEVFGAGDGVGAAEKMPLHAGSGDGRCGLRITKRR